MDQLHTPAELLALHGLHVCLETGSLICSKADTCGIEVPIARWPLWKHLKKYHNLETSVLRSMTLAASILTENIPEHHPLREKYKTGGASHGLLPKINGLPVLVCKQCPTCDRLFAADETLRKHSRILHGNAISRTAVKELVAKPSQCLGRLSKQAAPFLVTDDEVARTMSAVAFELSVYDPGHVEVAGEIPTDDRRLSSFVSLARCGERLSNAGLTVEKAAALIRAGRSGAGELFEKRMSAVRAALFGLFDEARALAREVNVFRHFHFTIATPGLYQKTKPFRFLINDARGDETSRRYARSAHIVVRVACLVYLNRTQYPDVPMSIAVEAAVSQFLATFYASDEKCFSNRLHDLLCAIFFEEASYANKNCLLFASVVCASLCTMSDGEATARLADGTIVSSRLSGIMYSASCCAALKVLKYARAEDKDEAVKEVQAALSPTAMRGVTLFTELRSICATVRAEESKLTIFRACTVHEMCGFVAGKEFSAKQLGIALRKINAEVHRKMFGQLLNNKTLPENFRNEVNTMVDDLDNRRVGYWALSDLANLSLVRKSCEWSMQATILHKMDFEAWNAWKNIAIDVLHDLLTGLHISSGGPGRGTEIGSLALRNTVTGRRGFYFIDKEVMILPGCNKTRAMKDGQMKFITRHMDVESSYLFKAFFLFIHPVIVVMHKVRMSGEPDDLLRGSILLGELDPENVASVIGKKFAEYGIPFLFSEYRHLQRGLIKMKASTSVLRLMTLSDDEEEDGELHADMKDAKAMWTAAAEQAGHTTRTANLTYAQSCAPGEIALRPEQNRVEMYRRASREWHKDLGVDDPVEEGAVLGSMPGRSAKPLLIPNGTSGDANAITSFFRQYGRPLLTLARDTMMQVADNFARTHSLIYSSPPRPDTSGTPATTVENRVSQHAVVGEAVVPNDERPPGSQTAGTRESRNLSTPRHTVRQLRLLGEAPPVFDFSPAAEQTEEETFGAAVERLLNDVPGHRRPFVVKAHGFEATEALRRVTHPSATFKSEAQKMAMEAVASRLGDVAVILATGAGKTAVVAGPCLYEQGVSIWVSPLRALAWETKTRLQKAGLQVRRIRDFVVEENGTGRVLLVSPEEVGLPEFRGVMTSLTTRQMVNRVIVDEAHLAVMAEGYRECFSQLKSVSKMGTLCPVVLLTATAPPDMLDRIADACGSSAQGLDVIRGDPCRANLALYVQSLENGREETLRKAAVKAMNRAMRSRMQSAARCLVVCLTVADVLQLGAESRHKNIVGTEGQVLQYHSNLSPQAREAAMKRWNAGKPHGLTVMFATEGFSTGTDASDVRMVVFAGGARCLLEFWQGAGRAGRDGKPAEVWVLYHKSHLRRSCAKDAFVCADKSTGDFASWAETNETCRRVGIEACLGGTERSLTCTDRARCGTSIELCDVCQTRVLHARPYPSSSLSRTVGASAATFDAGTVQRKRPSLNDNELEMSRRQKKARNVQDGIRRLRARGTRLKGLCLDCVVDRCQYTDQRREQVALQASLCGGSCWNRRKQCMRCLQTGHYAKDCNVIESVQTSGRRCCRRCFLISVDGESVHMANEFGKEGACPLEYCTKLLMVIWSRRNIRKKLLQDSGVSWGQNGKPATAKEFADWLLRDKNATPAGIISGMEWVYKHLDLSSVGL